MNCLIFDIETAPEADDIVESFFTFDETKVTNYRLLTKDFDPSKVKHANMKDPVKIAAKIEADRQKFEAKKASVADEIETKREEAFEKFKDKAAISPLTGQVLAIGWLTPEYSAYGYEFVSDNPVAPVSEKELIENFLGLADAVLSDGGSLIGHNIISFDLPFLLRRGLKYGIRPPKTITNALTQYRPTNLIDTMREWTMGNRTEDFVKLDKLAAFFGTQRKTGDGKDFGVKFFGTPEERQEVLDYLQNDVEMTFEVAKKMRLID